MRLPDGLRTQPGLVRLRRLAERYGYRIFLVGGAVRDLLMGQEPQDLDWAVEGSAFRLAKHLADACRGRFVPLDEEHDTARVVLRGAAWDLAGLRGEDILEDLRLRDFTCNAMGLELPGDDPLGDLLLLDPTGGRTDLEAGCIRRAGPDALRSDPVRVLRAYRFAAQLGFTIQSETRRDCSMEADRLPEVAGERLAAEWWKLAAGRSYRTVLDVMRRDRILDRLLEPLEPDPRTGLRVEGLVEGRIEPLDEHLLTSLRELWCIPYRVGPARTALLMQGSPGDVEAVSVRLRLSRKEKRTLQIITRGLGLARRLLRSGDWTSEDLLELFLPSGVWAPLLVAGGRLSEPEGSVDREALRRMWSDFQRRVRPVLEQEPPIRGSDVARRLGRGGPQVGRLLREVDRARIEGSVVDRASALEHLERCIATLQVEDPDQP